MLASMHLAAMYTVARATRPHPDARRRNRARFRPAVAGIFDGDDAGPPPYNPATNARGLWVEHGVVWLMPDCIPAGFTDPEAMRTFMTPANLATAGLSPSPFAGRTGFSAHDMPAASNAWLGVLVWPILTATRFAPDFLRCLGADMEIPATSAPFLPLSVAQNFRAASPEGVRSFSARYLLYAASGCYRAKAVPPIDAVAFANMPQLGAFSVVGIGATMQATGSNTLVGGSGSLLLAGSAPAPSGTNTLVGGGFLGLAGSAPAPSGTNTLVGGGFLGLAGSAPAPSGSNTLVGGGFLGLAGSAPAPSGTNTLVGGGDTLYASTAPAAPGATTLRAGAFTTFDAGNGFVFVVPHVNAAAFFLMPRGRASLPGTHRSPMPPPLRR